MGHFVERIWGLVSFVEEREMKPHQEEIELINLETGEGKKESGAT